ncbi:enoyl-CoA hydratase-related protein [Dactylosporangium matsuzakiense]|uniref:Enoyl-CoA hydratase n=1 Tax=Dactylosporangium matsuzakiense TaxID=53360 RepID=A0A9W6KDT8_9ACTN|nr:enoyl-CoA hydratase-related protein [Dactylosporangium matsuzakiense]UWZ47120.1 enoyl-CoA hydratase/isomerase family protein [Dactylosporangium matsuzakiense]GLK98445.1 enoyl-CoA hydratase [Dactylosporangium matsuzakiense]
MSADAVRLTADGPVATITLARPDRLNALDLAGMRLLTTRLREAAATPGVRSLLLTGEGRAFCTGADVSPSGAAAGGADGRAIVAAANDVVLTVMRTDLPVVAAVNGPAVGVGVSFAVACDAVIAADTSWFQLPFVTIGLTPDGGASHLLPAAIGRVRAARMALFAERVPAAAALSWGLISGTAPPADLLTTARALAAGAAAASREALRRTKLALRRAQADALEAAMRHELEAQTELLDGPDYAEGLAALQQKRRPVYPA